MRCARLESGLNSGGTQFCILGTAYSIRSQSIFGSYPDLRWYGSIYVDGTGFGKDSVQLSYQPPATINVSLSKPNAFFLFPGDPQIGQQYQLPTETITIQSVRKDGRVTGFARDFRNPGTLTRSSIYYFDGDRFQEIALSDNSE